MNGKCLQHGVAMMLGVLSEYTLGMVGKVFQLGGRIETPEYSTYACIDICKICLFCQLETNKDTF